MASTTKKLIANAMGSISVFKLLQVIFAACLSYCNSLPGNYRNPFLVSVNFWCPGLSLSRKHITPDFLFYYFQKNHP